MRPTPNAQRPTPNAQRPTPASLSVIVVTYNTTWERIRATLNSIILQKDINFDIILSDDASTENHFDKIKDFFARNSFTDYQLIAHEKNQGTVKNLLDAVSHSDKLYVKPIGQGDMLSDEYALRDMYNDFIETGASVSGSAYVVFVPQNPPIKLRSDVMIPQDVNVYRNGSLQEKKDSLLIKRFFVHGPTLIYKREVIIKYLKILSDAGIIYTEDIIPWLMVADEESVSFFNRITIFYETGAGFSSHHSKLMIRDHEEVIRLIIRRIQDDQPEFAQKLKELQAIRLSKMPQTEKRNERRKMIKEKLGPFAWIILIPFRFLKIVRNILRGYAYTSTSFPTDFANLCMTRE